MPNVEIIYIHRNKGSNSNDLEPTVNLHKTKPRIPPKEPYHKPKNSYKPVKRKRGPIYYVSIIIVFLILITAFTTTYNAGYIPIKSLMEVKEPSGNAREISYTQVKEKYPLIDSIPEIKAVKHKLYGTDDPIPNVANKYERDLLSDGFKLKYCDNTEIKGVNVHYYGYLKGFTAVVILMTSDDVGVANTETIVLYSTSNIFSYKAIINKYSNYFDF